MRYYDMLYGEWEPHDFIEKIIHTKEMVRLRNITQSVVPNSLEMRGPIPSRFQHGMGVCFLATIVLARNPSLSEYEKLLPIASFLHDAGSPPFSHLSEPFLKEITGYDGESFLGEILDGSETEKVLKEYGVATEDVVKMVTGNMKPVSEVLHGSLDIDNLDNVGRFAHATGLSIPHFNAKYIAAMFRLSSVDGWHFLDTTPRGNVHEHTTKNWQRARRIVYESIYTAPHLNLIIMLQRAVELAYVNGELVKDFFFLDDYAAMMYLGMCNLGTVHLLKNALRWNWYDEILSLEYTTDAPEKLKKLSDFWSERTRVADMLAKKLQISRHHVCAMISRGTDYRKITIPFVTPSGRHRYDTSSDAPIYRVKIYMPSTVKASKELIKDLVMQEIT